MYKILPAFALAILFALPQAVGAADHEIHYQSIDTVVDGAAIVVDKSPDGETRYECDLTSGDCSELGENEEVQPELYGTRTYMTSSQGTYGVYELSVPLNGAVTTFFSIFDITENSPEFAGYLATNGNVLKRGFSPDETMFIVVTSDGTVTTYDIDAKQSTSVTISQTDLPFYNISDRGTYISAYNYVDEVHRIWNTRTGTRTEIPGAPSYVEFSTDETEAAFLASGDDFNRLVTATGFGNTIDTEVVASGDFVVEDYLYIDDQLFYMANKQSPLSWSIYAAHESTPIAENASYGDYMKRIDDTLAYLKIEGKNANVYLYDPESDTHTRLDAAPQSAAATDITRKEITIAGRTAAHLAPEDGSGKNLFIWLHGGPQRQTSLGYHPYLSYAVYDELLEKLASGGNHVLKLDYSGSWGYGQDFLERLEGRVGTVEINDVLNTIEEFTDEHDVANVYLIGNSYGGYMAFRAINETPEDIDGIISINGVADWYGLIATIPSSPFSRLFNGSPDLHNLPLYLSASVFTNFEGLGDQPLLVFYGTNDRTVPTSQSRQYHEFMGGNGKNVTLVALEDEEHVLRERETLTELCTTITEKLNLDDVQCR